MTLEFSDLNLIGAFLGFCFVLILSNSTKIMEFFDEKVANLGKMENFEKAGIMATIIGWSGFISTLIAILIRLGLQE